MVCCTKPEMTEVTVHVHCILYYKLHKICMFHIYIYIYKVKGKVCPITGHEDPERGGIALLFL